MESARYLAETGDLRWLPLLLDAAEKNAGISQYVAYAAELGGDRTLTELVALAKIPEYRMQALMAMGSTGSGQAIPILLDYLKSPDAATRERAVYGLRLLTHRSAGPDAANQDPQAAFRAWSEWWQRESATAPVYKDSECGLAEPLPLAP
jgi:HEAT repeat protein